MCFRQGTRTLYGVVQPLKLYNVNTPFEKEQWALVGLQNGAHLLASTQRIQRLILVSALVCQALGVCLMLLAARYLTKPLTNLVSALEKSDPDKPIRLPRLGMSEIDALTGAIENLSNSATESEMCIRDRLFTVGALTEVQKRRFRLHVFQGLSTRQIGRMEGTSHQAVAKSINLAIAKLKKYFAAQG